MIEENLLENGKKLSQLNDDQENEIRELFNESTDFKD